MANLDVSLLKEFAVGVTVRAGFILRRNFNDYLKSKPKHKTRHEIVCASDMEVHKFVRYKVRKRFPNHNFVSEEGDEVDNNARHTWVVDPLDGTLNYTIGNPFFCTSLTLLDQGKPVIGVLHAPLLREIFIVEKNKSARLNERNIHVSKERSLKNSVLSFSYYSRDKKSRAKSMELWSHFEDSSRAMRHLGCTTLELAYIACGRMEAAVIVPPLRLWDIANGILLIETAGGKITDFSGQEWNSCSQGLVATNGLVHRQILNILKKHSR